MKKKVLAICGSLRSQSYNLKLVRSLCKLMEQDFDCRVLDSKEMELPLFNEDIEAHPAESVLNFRAALRAADIVVIGSPEYNGGYTAALKNAIDWASRPPENIWAGKVALLTAASPGAMGGVRGLIQVRTILSGIKCWVIPEQVLCPQAHLTFDQDGTLKDEAVKKQMVGAIDSLRAFSAKYHRQD